MKLSMSQTPICNLPFSFQIVMNQNAGHTFLILLANEKNFAMYVYVNVAYVCCVQAKAYNNIPLFYETNILAVFLAQQRVEMNNDLKAKFPKEKAKNLYCAIESEWRCCKCIFKCDILVLAIKM